MAYLADLETIVRTQIRDNGATLAFQNAEIDQFIMDAIAQYSRIRPRKRPYTFNITANQGTYQLPTDWLWRDSPSFDRAKNPRPQVGLLGEYAYEFDIMLSMPANLDLRYLHFDFYDSDQTLVISPTPLSNYTLTFDYYALHQVTASTAQPAQPCTIAQQDQYAAMYWASAQALYALIADRSDKILIYRAKDVSVDNSKGMPSLQQDADGYLKRWEEWFLRPSGRRGGDLDRMEVGWQYYGAWGQPL